MKNTELQSAVYHFIDEEKRFSLTLFNAEKFINDLGKWQNFEKQQIQALKPFILTVQNLLTVIKNNESFGAYLEPSDKSFKFNIESTAEGISRLLLKHSQELDSTFTGLCRFVKYGPKDSSPYTSLVEFSNSDYSEITNEIISRSYQFDAKTKVFADNNCCILLTKFPHVKEKMHDIEPPAETLEQMVQFVNKYRASQLTEEAMIQQIQEQGFTFLSIKRVKLQCLCSQDKIIMTFRSMAKASIEEIFEKDDKIEVNCDYCSKKYVLLKQHLEIQ